MAIWSKLMPEFPMKPRHDITPIYFPCSECKSYMFHCICEQPYGMAFKIPLMRSPLASTHKAYFVVCFGCTTVNGQLGAEEISKLTRHLIPRSVHSLYPDIQVLYNPALLDKWKQENLQKMSLKAAEQVDGFVRQYRLEV
jgi:hypothetical protein